MCYLNHFKIQVKAPYLQVGSQKRHSSSLGTGDPALPSPPMKKSRPEDQPTPSSGRKPPVPTIRCPVSSCDWEETTSKYKLKLWHHLLKHPGFPRLCCDYHRCEARFNTEEEKKVHVAAVHKKTKTAWHCPADRCNRVCPSSNALRQHIIAFHPQMKLLLCGVKGCATSFKSGADQDAHYLEKHPEGLVPCRDGNCPKFFLHYETESRHHTSDHLQVTFHCLVKTCGEIFPSHLRRMHHLRSSHEDFKRYSCRQHGCEEAFMRLAEAKQHFKDKHQKPPPALACTDKDCSLTFLHLSALVDHQIESHSLPVFICSALNCGKKYTRHNSLQKHIEFCHQRAVHSCTWPGCLKEYPTRSGLSWHIQ